jgi:hypothetical protein
VVVTNDDVYAPGSASRHFPVGPNQSPAFIGGILPEILSKYEHQVIDVEFTPLRVLDAGPRARSTLIQVGLAPHDDFLEGFVSAVFPVYYSFLFSRQQRALQELVEVFRLSGDGEEFLERILTLVDLLYFTREEEFSAFSRRKDVIDLLSPR